MALTGAPVPLTMVEAITTELAKLANATQRSSVAILTAAVVSKMEKPPSLEKVLEIHRDFYFAMYPGSGSNEFQAWLKTKEATLKKVFA
jgi:hypothetical protein